MNKCLLQRIKYLKYSLYAAWKLYGIHKAASKERKSTWYALKMAGSNVRHIAYQTFCLWAKVHQTTL